MTAPTHFTGTPSGSAGARDVRLPWWAVVLPALAFCALQALIVIGGEADAAQRSSEHLTQLLGRLRQTLS